MADAASGTRIFVKGLPPTFTEAQFREHFAGNGNDVSDVKIFPNRRIGYVGYKTPEQAKKAVKYYNKTFIRMSRINVEIARPPPTQHAQEAAVPKPTAAEISSERGALKRKRDSEGEDQQDSKLKEFMEVMKPKSKKKAWENEVAVVGDGQLAAENEWQGIEEGQSDQEYEAVPKKVKGMMDASTMTHLQPQPKSLAAQPTHETEAAPDPDVDLVDAEAVDKPNAAISDSDWARSRTSRLLGLLDDEEEQVETPRRKESPESDEDTTNTPEAKLSPNPVTTGGAASSLPSPPDDSIEGKPRDEQEASMERNGRLFVRNLPYDVKQEDLEAEFATFGSIDEVHVPMDTKNGRAKGFAFIQFENAAVAEQALAAKDGQDFQGRLLHIIHAADKRSNKLDDFALSQLPLKKQQQIKRKREAALKRFNWNSLYMNADAVVSSVAERLGLSKSAVLDPTSSDAAVKQAHAETHVIQETKAYFRQQGVDLDSFKKSERGDTAILVKNIPYECSKDELLRLFEEHGDVKRFLIPPSGVIAIVEMANEAQSKTAYAALAYKRVKTSILFLEKAPKDLFKRTAVDAAGARPAEDGVSKTVASDLKAAEPGPIADTSGTATLFVRNLNFSTTTQQLMETFSPLSGFLSARVKTKTDPKKPGQILSMGFGFLEFASAQQAQAALQSMDGYTLEGHKLQIRASHKGADAAEERRKADAAKKAAGKKTKVIIKNLPFETSKKDVRALLGAYGQLRSVRVPKKIDRAARGFAFADFTTPKEAESAMEALKDTHLLGRRLVIDFAEGDPEDAEAEIEKMQKKVGGQVNKVALQKLTSGGRKKFSTENGEEDIDRTGLH